MGIINYNPSTCKKLAITVSAIILGLCLLFCNFAFADERTNRIPFTRPQKVTPPPAPVLRPPAPLRPSKPNPPHTRPRLTVHPPVRFENSPILVLAGSKDKNSAIYVNKQLAVPVNEYDTWYYEYPLSQNQGNGTLTVEAVIPGTRKVTTHKGPLYDLGPLEVDPPRIFGYRFDPTTRDFIFSIQDPPGVLSYNIYYANSLNGIPSASPFILAQSNVPVSGTGTTTWRDNGTYTGKHPSQVSMRFYKIEVNRVDVTAPTGSIRINNGASSTNSTSVTLQLQANDGAAGSGLSQMKFSNDNITWSTPEPYAAIKIWVLSSGNGVKVVYVRYKDLAGNWSSSVSAMIILNIAAVQLTNGQGVSGSISIQGEQDIFTLNANAGDVITIRSSVAGWFFPYLELYAPDGSKIAEYMYRIDKALPVTGKYTIVLRDFIGNNTGQYSIIYGTIRK